MSRSCDAFNCPATVSPGRFLCLKHWRMVPLDTQRTINSRYRACRADFGFLSDVGYLRACVAAISGIAHAEGTSSARDVGEVSSYGRLLRVAQGKAAS